MITPSIFLSSSRETFEEICAFREILGVGFVCESIGTELKLDS